MIKYIISKLVVILLLILLVLTVVACSSKNIDESYDAKNNDEVELGYDEESKDNIIVLNQESSKVIEVIATSFVADILNKDFTKAYNDYDFTKEMKAAINEAALGQILIGTKMQFGDFLEQETNYIVESNEYRAVFVQLEFEKDKMAFQVSFDMEDKIAGLFFAEFKEVDEEMAKASKEVTTVVEILNQDAIYDEIEFGLEEYRLPATITRTDETKLMVVMVHGSGPNDRDVTIGPNKVFKDIEQGLISENIGSFRYDKRTLVHGVKIMEENTIGLYEETVEDAVLAVKEIKDLYGDDMKIVVLGHSQGGHSIPYIAKELNSKALEVDGYIIMSGNKSPIYELIEMQVEYLGKLDGEYTEEEEEQVEDIAKGFEALVNGEDVDDDTPLFYATAGYWKSFVNYNVEEDADYINKATLVLNGSRDYQVPASEVELWKEVLGDKAEYYVVEGVNHLMMQGVGEANPSEYNTPGHVDDQVIKIIVDFLSDL